MKAQRFDRNNRKTNMFIENPVEEALFSGSRGNGEWKGFGDVYTKISDACILMGKSESFHLNDFHIASMADLGSGDEERMKYRLGLLYTYNWIK